MLILHERIEQASLCPQLCISMRSNRPKQPETNP
jgi:hypothetical protein